MQDWNVFWLAAAGLSAAVCAIHLFLGGKEIARRLLDHESLLSVARMTTYYAWHLTTLALALMSAGFVMSARPGASVDAAVLAVVFAGGSVLINLAFNLRWRLNNKHHPQWMLFLPVVAAGAAGFVA